MEIINDLLKNGGIAFVASPNIGPDFQSNPDTIILHYTAGGTPESAISTFKNPLSKTSSHLVIGRNGSITQMVPFNKIAWHAGESQYEGRTGFNKYSIGIEIDNAGLLEKRGDKYVSWFGRAYPEDEVVFAVHRNEFTSRYWHEYTEDQIKVVEDICLLLIEKFSMKYILGHEEISPGRKTDPGPAFPLDKIRMRLLGSKRDAEGPENIPGQELSVMVDGLNIRALPDINAEKIAKPLLKNQKVKIIEKKDGWVKVTTGVTGWVAEKYLK
jgi:N-acetylmuramoyl-L-alanine amidase